MEDVDSSCTMLHDRSKKIILGLLNGLKKRENEVFVYQKGVKCMFWLMIIPWAICLALLVIMLQRNGVSSFGKALYQCYIEICRSDEGSLLIWFSFVFFVNNLN